MEGGRSDRWRERDVEAARGRGKERERDCYPVKPNHEGTPKVGGRKRREGEGERDR